MRAYKVPKSIRAGENAISTRCPHESLIGEVLDKLGQGVQVQGLAGDGEDVARSGPVSSAEGLPESRHEST